MFSITNILFFLIIVLLSIIIYYIRKSEKEKKQNDQFNHSEEYSRKSWKRIRQNYWGQRQ